MADNLTSVTVVQINSVCGVGSTGRIATDIHSALKVNKVDSYIIYGRGKNKACENLINTGGKLSLYWHALQNRLLDNHGFSSSKNTKSILRILDELKPDVVHLHNIHGYYINVEMLFSYFKKHPELKVVWTLHDCWPFTGHCAHFDFIGCQRWKENCFSCPQKTTYPTSYLLDMSESNYRRKRNAFLGVQNLTIITPSRWLANLVKQSFLKDYPIHVVNNGIDLNIFRPRESDFRYKYNIEGDFLIMGAASSWSERKGLTDFISLAKKVPRNCKLIMVGLPFEKIKKLPKNIIGIPRTDNPIELAEIYSAADVFFNPTYEDNYPTVNLESIACGTPVITYRTGGSPESVCDKYGFVVNKGDVLAVLNILEFLQRNMLVIPKVPAEFGKDTFVKNMLSFYGL